MAADLAHNPQPWRMHSPDKHQLRRLQNKLREHREFAALVAESIAYITFLETEMTRVGKIALAAMTALANVPPQPDPSLVIDAEDVTQLGNLAAALKLDPTTGDPVPVTPPPAPPAA